MKMRFRIQKLDGLKKEVKKRDCPLGTGSIENKSTFSGIAKQIFASDRPLLKWATIVIGRSL